MVCYGPWPLLHDSVYFDLITTIVVRRERITAMATAASMIFIAGTALLLIRMLLLLP